MTLKMNRFMAALVLGAACCVSAAAQDKPPLSEEILNQIVSGLENSGTRRVVSAGDGQHRTVRRYRLVGADGCTLRMRMETESRAGGRNRFGNAVYTIPLSELDPGRIRTEELLGGFVTDLNGSKARNGDRRVAVVNLHAAGERKAIGVAWDYVSEGDPANGRQSFFRIEFKETELAEPVAEAFRRASRLCGAQASVK